MGVSFEQPTLLLLAALAAPMVVLAVRWCKGAMSTLRAWTIAAARAVLIVLLAAILAGAASVHRTDRLAVIAVVDVSDSVRRYADRFAVFPSAAGAERAAWDEVIRDVLERATEGRGPDDLFGVVVFDGRSIAVAAPSVGALTDLTIDYRFADGTDIASAIRLAGLMFQPDAARRLLLISDGVETQGDALEAAREVSSAGGLDMPIDVMPIVFRVQREVMVEAVDAPPRAGQGATIAVRVVLSATQATSGTLDLLYDGEQVDLNGANEGKGRRVALDAGRSIVTVDVPLRRGAIVHRFEPIFTPDDAEADGVSENNRGEAFTLSPGRGAILLVDGRGADGVEVGANPLPRTFERANLEARRILPAEVPRELLELSAYDLIILQDVAADDLPRETHAALADYVTTLGGGLVMIGGPRSLGAGGWTGTAIEPILPVRLDLPDDIIMPQAAIAIVLDASGSMGRTVLGGARTQQEIANDGAALAIETLDKLDLVTVIAFSSKPATIVPFGRNEDAARSAALVRAIRSSGGTNLYPALLTAAGSLENADAAIKHIIVLSDGRSQSPEDEVALAARLRESGMTISTIAVGDGADEATMANIAALGGGEYHRVVDPSMIPRIFLKEVRVIRRPLIRERPFTPIVSERSSPLVFGVEGFVRVGEVPDLRGLVLTRDREGAQATTSMRTPDGYPILAHWFAGRGRVAAFTSDATDWARDWRQSTWPGYSALWQQIARTIARPASAGDGQLEAEIEGDALVLRYEASDEQGVPIDGLSVPATVFNPDGTRTMAQLAQVGPGLYEGQVPARLRGNYFTVLSPRLGARALGEVTGGASRSLGAELRALRSDVQLLQRIASATGGRVLELGQAAPLDLFDHSAVKPVTAASPLWPILLVWTIVVFILDVATRRVAWDRLLSREVTEALRANAVETARARSRAAAATVAGLRRVGGRATAPMDRATAPEADGPQPRRGGAARAPADDAEAEARARRMLEAQEARRRALRSEMLERLGGQGQAGPQRPDQPKGNAATGPDDAPSTTSELLAKRRVARGDQDGKRS